MSAREFEAFRDQAELLAEAARRTGDLGYVASHGGNLSLRVCADRVLITPTKVDKRAMRAEDICMIDMDGALVYAPPGRSPTGETPMHLRILRRRPDLRSIVHAHPPVLTGFSISPMGELLSRPLLPEPVIEAGPLLVVPYAEPVSEALAEEFDKVIALTNSFLMKNHGVTVCGSDGIDRTLGILEMLEMQAYSVWVARCLGGVDVIPAREVAALENTLRTRKLPIPADPRVVAHLTDQY